jgi:hypothetical protein
MRTLSTVSAALVAGLSVFGLATASAQTNSATINATAVVLSPITVTGAVPLDFGNVTPGVAKTIAVTQAGAGRFNVTNQANSNLSLTFVLPINLTSGANNLPIGTWTGHHNFVNSPSTGTNFTPSAAATNIPANVANVGNLYVFVGGTVTPAAAQAAGTYTGTVGMTVVYY